MKTLAIAAALAATTALTLPAFAEGTGMKTDTQAQTGASSDAETQAAASTGKQAAGLSGDNLDEQEIRDIQQALKDAGADIEVDGVWGDSTVQALSAYQRDEGLTPSGELDQRTIASLGVTVESAGAQQAEMPEDKPEMGENAPEADSDTRPLPNADDASGGQPATD